MIAPRIVSLVAALVLTSPVALIGQEEPPVAPGDRVRVTAPTMVTGDQLVGTIVSMGPDTCVLEAEGRAEPLALPLASVTSLEVSRGKKSGALIGAGVGFVVGAVGGTLWWEDVKEPGTPEVLNPYVLAGFGGGGLLLGALVGSSVKTDRWEEIPLDRLRVTVLPQGRGGFSVGVRIRL